MNAESLVAFCNGQEWAVLTAHYGEAGDGPIFGFVAEGAEMTAPEAANMAAHVARAIYRATRANNPHWPLEWPETWISLSDIRFSSEAPTAIWLAAHPAFATELPVEHGCGGAVNPRTGICQKCGDTTTEAVALVLAY